MKMINITPKIKAIELVEKFIYRTKDYVEIEDAKQCAIIAVDEIIDLLPNINLIPPIERKPDEFYAQYWYSVKREIQLL